MTQTAVEWLLEHLEPNILWTDKAEKIAEQAKQMEKEQMGKIFKQAQECAVKADGVYFKYESFEQLDKTFKSK